MREINYYELLGVAQDADPREIKRAYRSLARKYHPDTGESGGQDHLFALVNTAFSVLSDATRRAAYDRSRPVSAAPATSPAPRASAPTPSPAPAQEPWANIDQTVTRRAEDDASTAIADFAQRNPEDREKFLPHVPSKTRHWITSLLSLGAFAASAAIAGAHFDGLLVVLVACGVPGIFTVKFLSSRGVGARHPGALTVLGALTISVGVVSLLQTLNYALFGTLVLYGAGCIFASAALLAWYARLVAQHGADNMPSLRQAQQRIIGAPRPAGDARVDIGIRSTRRVLDILADLPGVRVFHGIRPTPLVPYVDHIVTCGNKVMLVCSRVDPANHYTWNSTGNVRAAGKAQGWSLARYEDVVERYAHIFPGAEVSIWVISHPLGATQPTFQTDTVRSIRIGTLDTITSHMVKYITHKNKGRVDRKLLGVIISKSA